MKMKSMLMGVLALGCACAFGGESVVAQKLQTCDFLLNKDFKKNAKYYLCLFSASWCGPCRREMPRITKMYAETLKANPDIELIHFSRDQNDEKALAWAKEHDAQFPVVKPKSGNPLNLQSRGIPHLFILKADGTLVEEGHPASLFTAEKLRALKVGTIVRDEASSSTTQKACMSNDVTKNSASGSCRETIGDYTWSYSINNGEATICLKTGNGCFPFRCAVSPRPTGHLVIPSTLGGAKVTGIGKYALSGCRDLTAVTIPTAVTTIDTGAFAENGKLLSFTVDPASRHFSSRDGMLCSKDGSALISGINGDVKVPSGVIRIEDAAFRCFSGLTSVSIPESVTHIGSAFWCCGSLRTIRVSGGNQFYKAENGHLLTKDGKTLVLGVGGDITIPSGVTSIGDSAFSGHKDLTSVTIPSSVTHIGSHAFQFCSGLTSVTIPSNVKTLGQAAFFECNGLTAVIIEPGVTRLQVCAFTGCRSLKAVAIPSSVTSIESSAFSHCSELTSITMRGECPSARDGVFKKCGKLAAIHVPANAKSWAGMKEWQGIPLVFDEEKSAAESKVDKPVADKNVAAEKLQACDFLLNKDFKKNAKYYLCLFSASWCGPCRREMPRIAKMYAETLKADQDIELIHFSCDQNDEKALAWAKEHDVKFPVVKPKGGNPLNLQSRGIPHLFIVKADGTLVEEGHPAKLFCEEKLNELK